MTATAPPRSGPTLPAIGARARQDGAVRLGAGLLLWSALLLVTYIPALSLWLPGLMK